MVRIVPLPVLAALLLYVSPVSAQVRPVVDTPVSAPSSSTSLPDHKIVANDLLDITVYEEPELSQRRRVGKDGTIVMPYLKDALKVEGLLPRELQDEIARRYVDQQILVHPLVSVSILDYATHMVNVVGNVKNAGQFTITEPITLYAALAKAGWTTSDAGSELLLTVSASEPPRRINIEALQLNKDPSLNVMLKGDEVVDVPVAPKVWVTGNVTHPQPVPIRNPSDATVLKVVASAEGLTQYYGKTAYIYRADDKGIRHEIPVPLKDIVHHTKQDVPLLADDILLIPDDNGTKRRELLQTLQSLGAAGASAAIVTGLRP
jgi:protein involved in polysaccharide export with SLBB domain